MKAICKTRLERESFPPWKKSASAEEEGHSYTGADGKTSTWSQPSSLAAGTTLPWTPRIPASSNCITYKSNDLFAVRRISLKGKVETADLRPLHQAVSTTSGASASATTGSDGKSTPISTGAGASGAASTSTKGSSGAMALLPSSALLAASTTLLYALLF